MQTASESFAGMDREEAGNIRHHLEAAFLGFPREDIAPFLNHLIVMVPFFLDIIQKLFVLVDGGKRIHGTAVAVGPGAAARKLIDVHEFLDLILAGRNTDEGAAALSIHGKALGKAVADQDKNIFWQMAELLEDLADLFPFTGIVNIGYIKGKDSLFICSLDGIFQHVKHIFNIFRRQAESCRIMGRRVDDDKDTVLFLEAPVLFPEVLPN